MVRLRLPSGNGEGLEGQCLYGVLLPPIQPQAGRRLLIRQRYQETAAQAGIWLDWAQEEKGGTDPRLTVSLVDHSLWLWLREGRAPSRGWATQASAVLDGLPEHGPATESCQWRRQWLAMALGEGGAPSWGQLYAGWQRLQGIPQRVRVIWGLWLVRCTGDEEEWHRLRETTLRHAGEVLETAWLPCWQLERLRGLNREWVRELLQEAWHGAKVNDLWRDKAADALKMPRLQGWQRRVCLARIERHRRPRRAWAAVLARLQRQQVVRLRGREPSDFEQLVCEALQLAGETAIDAADLDRRLERVQTWLPQDREWGSIDGLARLAQFYLRLGEGYVALATAAEALRWERFWSAFPHPGQVDALIPAEPT